jgi:hypothetical protein
VPQTEYFDDFGFRSVIEVVPRSMQNDASYAWNLDIASDRAYVRLLRNQCEGARELGAK